MIITNNYLPDKKFCAFVSEGEDDYYKPWPDERGVQPRDLSLGYVDLKDFGRLHVYHVAMFKDKIKNL
jgi:hypothetical protein